MKIRWLGLVVCLWFVGIGPWEGGARAQSAARSAGYSSSVDGDGSPGAPGLEAGAGAAGQAEGGRGIGSRPFSGLAAQVSVGATGVGLHLATPLGPKLNLRAMGSYFAYNTNLIADKITYVGDLQFRRGSVSVDYFPFGDRGRESFRISPGFTFYTSNKGTATTAVAPGQAFFLNNTQYTSSTVDPVHGGANLVFGRMVAPSLTLGFGNMLPRAGAHWSVPFEIGFDYVGRPTVALNLQGSVCQGTTCSQIQADPSVQTNLKMEQVQLSQDLAGLRFWPVASIGVSYRFGR